MKLKDFCNYKISNNSDGTIKIDGDICLYDEEECFAQRFNINIPRGKILENGNVLMLANHEI